MHQWPGRGADDDLTQWDYSHDIVSDQIRGPMRPIPRGQLIRFDDLAPYERPIPPPDRQLAATRAVWLAVISWFLVGAVLGVIAGMALAIILTPSP